MGGPSLDSADIFEDSPLYREVAQAGAFGHNGEIVAPRWLGWNLVFCESFLNPLLEGFALRSGNGVL
jgi:hypothetical protein